MPAKKLSDSKTPAKIARKKPKPRVSTKPTPDQEAVARAVAPEPDLLDTLAETLSPRARMFVEYYLADANMNGAKAARMAGYSDAKNEAYRLLNQNATVRAYINARMNAAAMPATEVLYRLARIARGTLAPFIYEDDDELAAPSPTSQKPDRLSWNDAPPGVGLKPEEISDNPPAPEPEDDTPARRNFEIRLHTRRARANIDLIKSVKTVEGEFGTSVEIKTHDTLAALNSLARAHGIFKNQADQLLKVVDLATLSITQLDRIAQCEDLLQVLLSPGEQTPADQAVDEEAAKAKEPKV